MRHSRKAIIKAIEGRMSFHPRADSLQKNSPGVGEESNWFLTPDGPIYLGCISRHFLPNKPAVTLLSGLFERKTPLLL